MPDIERRASASWAGDLQTGTGKASTESGALRNATVTFSTRFEDEPGSNPEELIGAAHASCFSMALSAVLSEQGHTPDEINTNATVTLRKVEDGFKIAKVHLETQGNVPGIDEAAFKEAAEGAKQNCPVSVVLIPGLEEVTLDAQLVS